MDRIEQLNALVAQFNLNAHPFYQDWRMGTLRKDKLAQYSAEYGAFVATIAKGWETIGEHHYADEEREHEVLWSQFKNDLGVTDGASLPSTETLVTAANNLFGSKPEAMGALFAFEAQQPLTAQSKLDGLNEHYNFSEKGKEYFAVHANDFNEVEDLKTHIAGLSDAEFARARTACAIVCASMFSALDGIYYAPTTVNA